MVRSKRIVAKDESILKNNLNNPPLDPHDRADWNIFTQANLRQFMVDDPRWPLPTFLTKHLRQFDNLQRHLEYPGALYLASRMCRAVVTRHVTESNPESRLPTSQLHQAFGHHSLNGYVLFGLDKVKKQKLQIALIAEGNSVSQEHIFVDLDDSYSQRLLADVWLPNLAINNYSPPHLNLPQAVTGMAPSLPVQEPRDTGTTVPFTESQQDYTTEATPAPEMYRHPENLGIPTQYLNKRQNWGMAPIADHERVHAEYNSQEEDQEYWDAPEEQEVISQQQLLDGTSCTREDSVGGNKVTNPSSVVNARGRSPVLPSAYKPLRRVSSTKLPRAPGGWEDSFDCRTYR